MNEKSIIPPVRAGRIDSELTIEYDHDRRGDGSFTATGVHEWTFDLTAYNELTGLDLGGDYPYVHQENGHTLRIVTEYTWMHGNDSSVLHIEERAYRGTHSWDETYWTRCGYYDLDSTMQVTRTGQERQQYRERKRMDEDVPHFDIPTQDGYIAYDGEQFVRKLHSGIRGPTLSEQFSSLIEYDSPADAVTVDAYMNTDTQTPSNAD